MFSQNPKTAIKPQLAKPSPKENRRKSLIIIALHLLCRLNPEQSTRERRKISLKKSLQSQKTTKIPLLAKKIEGNLKKGLGPSLKSVMFAFVSSFAGVPFGFWGACRIEQFVSVSGEVGTTRLGRKILLLSLTSPITLLGITPFAISIWGETPTRGSARRIETSNKPFKNTQTTTAKAI